ncbi:hypothetical protein [Actinomadura bangladeshensis]|uniref:Uncharacterized protein n=1 Tax=Actinomadura bangladeshensis TaxID=453573 RepID=A0A6L9QAQ8_9ACTN|nr:hypothetical protein [Actinomadura bangladeshensis]NEA22587.1 hypothetical protein [Actinomadura bangladeshensis]
MEWRAGEAPLIELAALYDWLPEDSATKAAQAGDEKGRRWGEQEWMLAAQITYLQTVVSILWVGLQLKGRPPKFTPVQTPVYTRPVPTAEEKAKQDAHLARVAALRKFSPSQQPAADTPP